MPDKKQGMEYRITVRLDGGLYRQLKEKSGAYGMDISKYVRYIIEKDAEKTKPGLITAEERIYRKQIIYEINKIGTNINQIVKNVNSHFYVRSEKKKLFELMQDVYKKLEDISKNGRG